MEQNNNIACIFVVEVQCRKATIMNGKCKLTDEHKGTRIFSDYATARDVALYLWEEYKAREKDSRIERITDSGKLITSYISTDIWVSRYDCDAGEFLYQELLGHLTSSDCYTKEPILSHIL